MQSLAIAHDDLSNNKMNLRFMLAMLFVFLVLTLLPDLAHAQSGPLPWETFTNKLACTLSGNWVKWMAVIAIALGGVMFGLGELSGPFQKMMQIAGGFSIALGAVGIVNMLLNTSGTNINLCT